MQWMWVFRIKVFALSFTWKQYRQTVKLQVCVWDWYAGSEAREPSTVQLWERWRTPFENRLPHCRKIAALCESVIRAKWLCMCAPAQVCNFAYAVHKLSKCLWRRNLPRMWLKYLTSPLTPPCILFTASHTISALLMSLAVCLSLSFWYPFKF